MHLDTDTLPVVPLVGTWIEIHRYRLGSHCCAVVPLVGTWIEISLPARSLKKVDVVPLVGTWIEITVEKVISSTSRGRPPCGDVD